MSSIQPAPLHFSHQQLQQQQHQVNGVPMEKPQVIELKRWLTHAPEIMKAKNLGPVLSYTLPNGEQISCVLWKGVCHITGTDIVKILLYRFQAFGRPILNVKKFEEGVFSDLRNLRSGTEAVLEEPRSEFLEFLFKHGCIRTQKKQKVFFWYSVPHDSLFLDALERDIKRETNLMQINNVMMTYRMTKQMSAFANPYFIHPSQMHSADFNMMMAMQAPAPQLIPNSMPPIPNTLNSPQLYQNNSNLTSPMLNSQIDPSLFSMNSSNSITSKNDPSPFSNGLMDSLIPNANTEMLGTMLEMDLANSFFGDIDLSSNL